MIEEAMRTWETAIIGINEFDINRALNEMPLKFVSFPPTLGEFVSLCKSYQGSRGDYSSQSKMHSSHNDPRCNTQQPHVDFIISEGAKICVRIKKIYSLPNWNEVPKILAILMQKVREMLPSYSELEVIKFIQDFNDQNFDDLYEVKKGINV